MSNEYYRTIEMERKMNELTDRRVDAWQFVEGFLYD
jgi:hypothetical protein